MSTQVSYEDYEAFAEYVNYLLGGERMDLDEMARRLRELLGK